MKTLRHISIVCLAVLATALFASAAPARQDQPAAVTATAEKASTDGMVQATPAIVTNVILAEEVVSLNGRSTYALSSCRPTFAPKFDTGIDRQRPATRPPNS